MLRNETSVESRNKITSHQEVFTENSLRKHTTLNQLNTIDPKFKCLSLMGGPLKLFSPCLSPNPGCKPSCGERSQYRLQNPTHIYWLLHTDAIRHKNFKSFDVHAGHQRMTYFRQYFIFNDGNILHSLYSMIKAARCHCFEQCPHKRFMQHDTFLFLISIMQVSHSVAIMMEKIKILCNIRVV